MYNENEDTEGKVEEKKDGAGREDLTDDHKDASETKNAGKSDNNDYEDVCFRQGHRMSRYFRQRRKTSVVHLLLTADFIQLHCFYHECVFEIHRHPDRSIHPYGRH